MSLCIAAQDVPPIVLESDDTHVKVKLYTVHVQCQCEPGLPASHPDAAQSKP